MMSLNNTVEDVIEKDFLPMLECRVGEDYVRAFADIMIFSKRGNESKDINAMMQSFGVPLAESNLRLLMEAFRPFADTVSTMSEDHMAMTRMSLRVACQRRYAVSTMHICIESGGKGLVFAMF
jgi:chloramphenicol 3-O-phosphotransferase